MSTFDIALRLPEGFDIHLQDPFVGSDRVKAYDGATWPKAPSKFWNGVAWELVSVKTWNGSAWVE